MEPRCCHEYKCRRAKPIVVRKAALSGRWMVITDYVTDGSLLTAHTKHELDMEDFERMLVREGWSPPPDAEDQ
jgi:hypothetical protein